MTTFWDIRSKRIHDYGEYERDNYTECFFLNPNHIVILEGDCIVYDNHERQIHPDDLDKLTGLLKSAAGFFL